MILDIFHNSAFEPSATTEKGVTIALEEDRITYQRILVPIDFSEHSKRTISYATRFATRYNASVQLLHVFKIPDYVETPYGRGQQTCGQNKSLVDAAEQEARDTLSVFENQLLNDGVQVKAYVRVGEPFEEIVRMASHFDVDLIIIGSHGYTGIKRLLVGSTAQRVVERASCPVLVVKKRLRTRNQR